MQFPALCFGAALLFAVTATADDIQKQLLAEPVPGNAHIMVVCWSVEASSQITIYREETVGQPQKLLYQSGVEGGYLPQLRFLQEIHPGGIPLILIQRNWGASISRLEVFGSTHGRMSKLGEIRGFQFDIDRTAGKPAIVAHNIENHEDIRTVYRWNGSSFVAAAAKKRDQP
jgi:hypothetical protein